MTVTTRAVQCSECRQIFAVTGEPWTPPPLYSWHVLLWDDEHNEAIQMYRDQPLLVRQGISLLHAVNRCPGLWQNYPESAPRV